MKVGRSSLLTLSRTVCLVPFFFYFPYHLICLFLTLPPSLPQFFPLQSLSSTYLALKAAVHQCLPTVSLFQWFNNSFIQLTMSKAHLTAHLEPILGFNIMQLSTQQKKGVSKHSFSLMHFLQSFLICAWEYCDNLLEIYSQNAFRQVLPRPNDPIFMQKVSHTGLKKNMMVSI